MQIPRPPPRPILSLVVGPSGRELAQTPALTRVPSPTVFCQEPVPCTVHAYRLPCSVHSQPALITEICHSWPEWVRVHHVSCHDVRRTHRRMTEFFVSAHVLSGFLPEAPSGFITHSHPQKKREQIRQTNALMGRVPELSGYYSVSRCPPGNMASGTPPSPSSPKPAIHKATPWELSSRSWF